MSKENIRIAIGKIIKDLRTSRNLTQKEVSEKIQISQAKYSDIENGKSDMSFYESVLLSRLFNTCIYWHLSECRRDCSED